MDDVAIIVRNKIKQHQMSSVDQQSLEAVAVMININKDYHIYM